MSILNSKAEYKERQLVTFFLGNDEFGSDIMSVKEIVRISEITKLPNTPIYIEGICNLRGNILPIIDGRSRLNMNKKDKDENSRVLVIDIDGKLIGMIVDKVSEVMRIAASEIEEPPAIIKGIDVDYLEGVVKLNNGKRLILLLDLIKVLQIDECQDVKENSEIDYKQILLSQQLQEKIEEEHLVSFMVGQEEYGISIMKVKEIIRVPDIVKVPNCDYYLEGVVAIRNQLLPIINLRKYFNMEYQEVNDRTRILVVDMGDITAGIMVDKVSEVMRISKNTIQPPPAIFSNTEDKRFRGVAKLNAGKRLILLLDSSKLVSINQIKEVVEIENQNTKESKTMEIQRLEEEQLVTFKLDDEEYAIKIKDVQEINRMTEVSKIPRAPFFIEGIVNLRGNIIPALDLRKRFNLKQEQRSDSTRIIIIDVDVRKTGIIVDAVSEVLRFEKNLIEPPPEIINSGVERQFIESVAKLNEGKRMILILDLNQVLSLDNLSQVEVKQGKKGKKVRIDKG